MPTAVAKKSSRTQPAHSPPGIAQQFHSEAEYIARSEGIFLGDAFARLRKDRPELYVRWKRETSSPNISGPPGKPATLREDKRKVAADIRRGSEQRHEEEFAGFVAARPFRELHTKLTRLMHPSRKGPQVTTGARQLFYNRLFRRGVRLSICDLQEILTLLDQAAEVAGRHAAFDRRWQRALTGWEPTLGVREKARRFDVMRGQHTKSGPRPKRDALPVVATYLALTTGVIRPPADETAWCLKTYADYEIEPPPIPKCSGESYVAYGLPVPERYEPTDTVKIPVSRFDAIIIVGKHYGWEKLESCVKFLERHGVAGLPAGEEWGTWIRVRNA